ncbi:GNAT family N-acetyltransferase [Bacillus pinisoli]|uniref:GNAT family N-acetyltransferase n=1 Tax=Bacillus pinisoli TaxID=2901866 RepID=UPI001FF4319C|nr:GNAT family N-acetyltransferase [Bacillus pinisoli]
MKVIRATVNDIEQVVELFDLYRRFYKQPSDLNGATQFIKERLENNESTILLCVHEERAVGFTQLYPMFSSVSMRKSLVLNDLYVIEDARRLGVGNALIDAAIQYGKEIGAKGVSLETGADNVNAQRLYEKIGFEKESNFFYFYSI